MYLFLGLAYLPFSAAYGLTANLINFVPLMSWRGLVPILGFVVSCVGLISLPFSSRFERAFYTENVHCKEYNIFYPTVIEVTISQCIGHAACC